MAQRLDWNYSALTAPLIWEGRGIGVIVVARDIAECHSDSHGFSPQEHALLKTFADQAVIAIQNAKMFNQTQEALHKVEERTGSSPSRWSTRRPSARCCA